MDAHTQVERASKTRTRTGTLSQFDEGRQCWLIVGGRGEPLVRLDTKRKNEDGWGIAGSEGDQIIYEVAEEGSRVVSRVVSIVSAGR